MVFNNNKSRVIKYAKLTKSARDSIQAIKHILNSTKRKVFGFLFKYSTENRNQSVDYRN